MVKTAKKSDASSSSQMSKNCYLYEKANLQEQPELRRQENGAAAGGVPDVVMKDGDNDPVCCGLDHLKFSLHVFNVLFVASGAALVAVGVWTLLEKHPSLILLTSGLYDVTACMFIAAGLLILAAALAGFCGACRNSRVTVLGFSILLFALFLAEVFTGALAYFYRDRLTEQIGASLMTMFNQKYGLDTGTTGAVDHLQVGLKCCGVESFEDWHRSNWWNMVELRGDNLVPDSCCITPSKGCGVRDHPSNIRYTGCIDRVAFIANDHLIIIGAVALSIGAIQLIGVMLACCLQNRIKKLYCRP